LVSELDVVVPPPLEVEAAPQPIVVTTSAQ
jgi:hypothetical protein